MDNTALQKKGLFLLTMLWLMLTCLVGRGLSEIGDCKEQEYFDNNGICRPCKQCGPGKELSKECGFGYGEDAQCLPCRPNRFKEDWGFQKCKTCLDCATVNRYQKTNCTSSANAVCGECLSGYYRKTKLGGFQDMECVPCGDPPPTYEPHCSKVNLVKITATASSPRDTALAAVICSALSTVLLALLILSVIYCKRQFMEKKTKLVQQISGSAVRRLRAVMPGQTSAHRAHTQDVLSLPAGASTGLWSRSFDSITVL